MSEDAVKFNNDLVLPRKYRRPTLAEFVAAGYLAERYESHIASHEAQLAEAYASGEVTDESFGSDSPTSSAGLPDTFHVRSQVRQVATRTLRAKQPTRHRFKQYLFGNPSKRLTRKRPVRITSDELLGNLSELREKEAAGILSVHALDGRRVNLSSLSPRGIERPEFLAPSVPPAPLPHPPLDSLANDVPAGEAQAQYVDGTFSGDPAAQRAVERITQEKEREASRQGATEDEEDEEPTADQPVDAQVDTSAPVDPEAVTELAPVVSDEIDPAAQRSEAAEKKGSSKKGKRS